jgi:CheY-like chemotaxis protein
MKKILIVDDEPNIVMSLEYNSRKTILRFYSTRRSEALDIFTKTTGCDYSDVMMPMVDGLNIGTNKKRGTIAALQSHFSAKKQRKNILKKDLH